MRPTRPTINVGERPQVGERRVCIVDAPRRGHLGPMDDGSVHTPPAVAACRKTVGEDDDGGKGPDPVW